MRPGVIGGQDSPQHFIFSHKVIPETGQSCVVGVSVVIDDCGDPPVIEYSLLDLSLDLHCEGLQVALSPLHLLLESALQFLDPLLLDLILLSQLVNLPALLVEDLPQSLHLLPLQCLHQIFYEKIYIFSNYTLNADTISTFD